MNNLTNLENSRIKLGDKKFIELIEQLIITDKSRAIYLINTQNISIFTFFLMINSIKKHQIEFNLSHKYMFILKILDELDESEIDSLYLNKNFEIYNFLTWIFKSGYKFDGYSNDFDKILDHSAVILLHYYNDYSILSEVCALIFKRNRENLYNHDLIWAYFNTKNIKIFKNILNYLKSKNNTDKDFAHELLSYITDEKVDNTYNSWRIWEIDNSPYLYFNGEHFQQTSNPKTYHLDIDSKFLGKPCINYCKNNFTDKYHTKTLQELHKYDEETVKTACNYSILMQKSNNVRWNNLSVDDKVNLATKYAKEIL